MTFVIVNRFKETELSYGFQNQEKYEVFVSALPIYGFALQDNKIVPTIYPSEEISDLIGSCVATIENSSKLILPSRELPEMLAYQKHLISALYDTTKSYAGYDFLTKAVTPEEQKMIDETTRLVFTTKYTSTNKTGMRVINDEFNDGEKERAAELMTELEKRNFWGLQVVLENYERIIGKPLPKQVHF